MGLHRAWPDAVITGVDLSPQKNYPFNFVQADAMEVPLEGYDFIWASPPCQGYSIMRNLPWLRGKEYPLLIIPTRERLNAAGVPYCIENVMGAKWRKSNPGGMQAGWLCGTMFGLPFYRHRLMETNFLWLAPGHPPHIGTVRNGRTMGARARDIVFQGAVNRPLFRGQWEEKRGDTVEHRKQHKALPVIYSEAEDSRGKESWPGRRGEAGHGLTLRKGAWGKQGFNMPAPPGNGAQKAGCGYGHAAGVAAVRVAMQIDWMTREEITQAVPPAYSEFIARQVRF